jgi:hypothetical protein
MQKIDFSLCLASWYGSLLIKVREKPKRWRRNCRMRDNVGGIKSQMKLLLTTGSVRLKSDGVNANANLSARREQIELLNETCSLLYKVQVRLRASTKPDLKSGSCFGDMRSCLLLQVFTCAFNFGEKTSFGILLTLKLLNPPFFPQRST